MSCPRCAEPDAPGMCQAGVCAPSPLLAELSRSVGWISVVERALRRHGLEEEAYWYRCTGVLLGDYGLALCDAEDAAALRSLN